MWVNVSEEILLWTFIFLLGMAQVITLLFTIYQTVISLLGMFKPRNKTCEGTVGYRYAVLVCAHNESAVVGDIVRNLQAVDYPKSLYDVYVICDNCTDNTADIVRANGGIALERHDPRRKGKGYGIQWALEQLWLREIDGIEYDAIAFFDADNLVTPNLLRMASIKLREGYEVLQVYLDSKNPRDTWVSKSYAFAYWATNRIYQLARENLGLSAQLGGTGMVMSVDVLKRYGWGATSLTEDLEFTALYILNEGRRVAWVHDARIFDEKPLGMKPSYIQRTRWMKGHFDCAERYTWPLLKQFLRRPRLLYLDMAIYLIQPTKIALAMAGLGFFVLSLFVPLAPFISNWVLNSYVWWGALGPFYLIPFVGLIMEKQSGKLWWFVQVYIFSMSWIPIVAVAWFKRKEKTWTHTQHTRSISSNEFSA